MYDELNRWVVEGRCTSPNLEYNDLGRIKTDKRNGHAKLKTDYAYNVRSWTKSISSPLFAETLYYNDKRANGTNTASFNGNISGLDWKATATNEGVQLGYDFAYDDLSRLAKADYLQANARSANFNTSYSYDSNGNITALQRRGQTGATAYGLLDNLSFTLNGNQLKSVSDASTLVAYNDGFDFKDGAKLPDEYAYDANGCLTKDLNKQRQPHPPAIVIQLEEVYLHASSRLSEKS